MSEKKRFPSDKQDQYIVRFPHGMRDELKERAAGAGRSMNSEIVQRLKDSLNVEADPALRLDLSPTIMDTLITDANARNVTWEEHAVSIIENYYGKNIDNKYLIDKISHLERECYSIKDSYLSELELRTSEFLLYYAKIIQMSNFSKAIIANKEFIPQKIYEMAENNEALCSVEIEKFKDRNTIHLEIKKLNEEIEQNKTKIEQEIKRNA